MFFGDLGGVKQSSKNEGNWTKNHRSVWMIFGAFVLIFRAQNCKLGLGTPQREILLKHYKYI